MAHIKVGLSAQNLIMRFTKSTYDKKHKILKHNFSGHTDARGTVSPHVFLRHEGVDDAVLARVLQKLLYLKSSWKEGVGKSEHPNKRTERGRKSEQAQRRPRPGREAAQHTNH